MHDITTIDDLKKMIGDLFRRFDTSPSNYTKADFHELIHAICHAFMHLYKKEETGTINPNLLITSSLEYYDYLDKHICYDNKIVTACALKEILVDLLNQVPSILMNDYAFNEYLSSAIEQHFKIWGKDIE